MTEILSKIKPVLDKYSMTARIAGASGGAAEIRLYNRKGEFAGAVNPASGAIWRRMDGKRAVMGALVRDDLKAVLL